MCSSLFSPSVCCHIWKRDDNRAAAVLVECEVPRDAQQHPGVHEAVPGAQGAERAGDGLRRVLLGRHQRNQL